MAITTQSDVPSRNRLIVSAIYNRFKLDPKAFHGDVVHSNVKSLCENILMPLQSGSTLEGNGEVMKWIEFAENSLVDSEACLRSLNELNGCLASKSVLVGEGLTPSEADIIVFAALYSFVKGLSDSDRESLPHLMRWMDYIQNKENFGETFEHILVVKDIFEPPAPKIFVKAEVDSNEKKAAQGMKDTNSVEKGSSSNKTGDAAPKIVDKVEVDPKAKKTSQGVKDANSVGKGSSSNKTGDVVKAKGDSQATTEKKKLPEKVADEKDKDISVSLLKIQVGLIRKAWKHPSADSLLVEEIDIGDAKLRQVVSGLAKYCSPDDLTNRRVALITNVKPGKLRDVMSEGLVLCASNEDHSVVEPIIPPEGAKVGECVSFSGHEGKPEDVLNPKKKQLEKITPHLVTDDKGVATFKGIPFMTSGGPCTSSIPNASIK